MFVHGREEYNRAIETTGKLFSQQKAPAESLSVEDLQSLEGIVTVEVLKDQLNKDVVSFLADTRIFPSKGEARKMIQNGGVSINRTKVSDATFTVNESLLLHQQYLLIQKGRKNYYLVKAI